MGVDKGIGVRAGGWGGSSWTELGSFYVMSKANISLGTLLKIIYISIGII